jgi:hypothetical protein
MGLIMTIIVLALRRRLRVFFRYYVDLKKKRVGYPSVINFEGQSRLESQEICNLFARFMERTYANEPWVPSDPGPDYVSDEPPFGSLQFTVSEVLNALLDLDSNKGSGPDGVPPLILKNCALHCHFVCSSTGQWHLAFFLIGRSSRLSPLSPVVSG